MIPTCRDFDPKKKKKLKGYFQKKKICNTFFKMRLIPIMVNFMMDSCKKPAISAQKYS